jgi:hypothetical protein
MSIDRPAATLGSTPYYFSKPPDRRKSSAMLLIARTPTGSA